MTSLAILQSRFKRLFICTILSAFSVAAAGCAAPAPSQFDLRCGAPEPFDNCGALL